MRFGTMPRDTGTHDKRIIASDSCIDIRSVMLNVKECARLRINELNAYYITHWSMGELNALREIE